MILVRHGESEFNVHYARTRVDPGIEDPVLTDLGRDQIRQAAGDIALQAGGGNGVTRIIASPYRRTLQTAEIIASVLALPVVIEPMVRERAFFACDVGSPRSHLAADFPDFEFGDLPERWWPPLDETEDQLDLRCSAFRAQSAGQPDWPGLLVVSHWGFIRGLTGEAVANGTVLRFDPTSA